MSSSDDEEKLILLTEAFRGLRESSEHFLEMLMAGESWIRGSEASDIIFVIFLLRGKREISKSSTWQSGIQFFFTRKFFSIFFSKFFFSFKPSSKSPK